MKTILFCALLATATAGAATPTVSIRPARAPSVRPAWPPEALYGYHVHLWARTLEGKTDANAPYGVSYTEETLHIDEGVAWTADQAEERMREIADHGFRWHALDAIVGAPRLYFPAARILLMEIRPQVNLPLSYATPAN